MCLENNTAMIGTAWFLEQRLKQEKIPCDLQSVLKKLPGGILSFVRWRQIFCGGTVRAARGQNLKSCSAA